MPGSREENVVGYAGGSGETGERREAEQRRERPVGDEVEIEINSAVMVEEEVAQGIDALDGIWVGKVRGEEVRIASFDEFETGFVCPELFFSALF